MTGPNTPPAPDDQQDRPSRRHASGQFGDAAAFERPQVTAAPSAPGGVIGGRRVSDDWLDQAAATATSKDAASAAALRSASRDVNVTQFDVTEDARARARAKAVAEQHALSLAQARERAAAESEQDAEAKSRALAAAAPAIPPMVRDELRPQARRDRSRYFGIHIGQVMTWEGAAFGLLAAHRQPLAVLIPVAVIAIAAVVATAIKVNGRWLYQWLGLRARFHTRRRAYAGAPGDADTLLASILRGAKMETVEIDDDEMAIVSHAGGFTAILEPGQENASLTSQSIATSSPLPPLNELLPTDDDGPLVSAQIVVHTMPAPGMAGEQDAAAKSYAELNGGSIPAQRRVWIALQAQHTADEFTGAQMRGALVNAVRRLGRKLRKSKLSVNILSQSETAAEFLAMLNPSSGAIDAQHVAIAEGWGVWSAGSGVHASYRVLGWPNLADETRAMLVDRLSTVPTLSTTIGVAARRSGSDLELEATVRVLVIDEAAATRVNADLMRAAADCGAQLQRLDGEQVFGVGASVPLGGFAA